MHCVLVGRNPELLLLYIKHSLSHVTSYVEMPHVNYTYTRTETMRLYMKSKVQIPA
jgi:hypothetical protein